VPRPFNADIKGGGLELAEIYVVDDELIGHSIVIEVEEEAGFETLGTGDGGSRRDGYRYQCS
jgi:hypothetical protein